MKFSRTRLLAATVLAGLLVAGGAAIPAAAALPSGDTTVVTVRGHVTDTAGKPITGIYVQATCPCDSPPARYALGRDRTSSTGFYSFTVQRQYAKFITFDDRTQNYFSIGYYKTHLHAVASGYRADATMEHVSVISGTITASSGGIVGSTSIRFFDATTGKGKGSAYADSKGSYTARLKAGSYKVQFGNRSAYVNSTWYGGVASSAESPTVTVGYAKTVTRIDQTLTPKPTISGVFRIDGKKPFNNVSGNLRISLLDAAGAELQHTVSRNGFFFDELTPGTFTISARPTASTDPFVQPIQQTVTLAPGSAVSGLVVNLTSVPATAASTRSTGVDFTETSRGIAKAGTVLKGKITLSSYGSVAGGELLIYVDGSKVDSRIVPASGNVNWKYRPTKVVFGKFHVTVKFLGTETARARSYVIYSLQGG